MALAEVKSLILESMSVSLLYLLFRFNGLWCVGFCLNGKERKKVLGAESSNNFVLYECILMIYGVMPRLANHHQRIFWDTLSSKVQEGRRKNGQAPAQNVIVAGSSVWVRRGAVSSCWEDNVFAILHGLVVAR